jgi:hypothetical protein
LCLALPPRQASKPPEEGIMPSFLLIDSVFLVAKLCAYDGARQKHEKQRMIALNALLLVTGRLSMMDG